MHTITRRLAVVLAAVGLLVAAGCAKDETVATTQTTTPVTASSSGSGSGPAEEPTTTDDEEGEDPDADKDPGSGTYADACSKIDELEALEDDRPDAAVLDLMEEARDASPDELAEHWDTLLGIFDELLTLDEDREEDVARMLELMDDPDYLEAAAAIDDFAEEECGMDIALDPTEESDDPGGRVGDDEIGAPTDDDPTSIDNLQAYLADVYGDEDWWPVLDDATGWSVSGASDVVWSVDLSAESDWETLTTTDLEGACEAIAAFLAINGDYDTVSIDINDPDGAALVSSFEDGPCEAA